MYDYFRYRKKCFDQEDGDCHQWEPWSWKRNAFSFYQYTGFKYEWSQDPQSFSQNARNGGYPLHGDKKVQIEKELERVKILIVDAYSTVKWGVFGHFLTSKVCSFNTDYFRHQFWAEIRSWPLKPDGMLNFCSSCSVLCNFKKIGWPKTPRRVGCSL